MKGARWALFVRYTLILVINSMYFREERVAKNKLKLPFSKVKIGLKLIEIANSDRYVTLGRYAVILG